MEETKTINGIDYKIEGDVYPVLTLALKSKDEVYSEAGAMIFMTSNIRMKSGIKGFFKIFSRLFTKEKLFVTSFSSINGEVAKVSFSANLPGVIYPLHLKEGEEFYCQKDSFLCAEPSIELKATLAQGWMAALFGGEGLILQKIKGPGTVFLEIDGQAKVVDLREDEKMNIDEGNLAVWNKHVKYTTKLTKGGPVNWFVGGEGLFMGQAIGPGRIILQTLPAKKLAKALMMKAYATSNNKSKNNSGLSLLSKLR